MSFKLQHEDIAGESYLRCCQIVIDNPLGGARHTSFHLEKVWVDSSGRKTVRPHGIVGLGFDPTAEIPLLDAETAEPIGEVMTHEQVMQVVYSAYMAAVNPPNPEVMTDEEISS